MIEILRIVGAFGIRGAVRIESYSDNLKKYKKLYNDGGEAFAFRVLKSNVVALENINDRNAAEALKGKSLFVKEDELEPLENGEFYLHDLIGREIKVRDSENKCIITDVCNYGAGDIIELSYDERRFLVPFTNTNFPESNGELFLSADAFKNFRE